jgi:predicted phage baseplate assembly protein
VLPVVTVSDARGSPWQPQRDLLGSDAFAREFVVEVEDDGRATLRFGDDRYGQRPAQETSLAATYRVGNGSRGNVGADSISHLVLETDAATAKRVFVRNPLPARGGTEPESMENVRQVAPAAFRTAERAVTPDDYARMAERHPQVQRAQATVRWTGSWRTVFLTVDRAGGLPVDAAFERDLRRFLERWRLAGHDLEVDEPRWVPLEVEVFACVGPGYFRADVERALRAVLGSRQLPDGRRGLFHPDSFTFGQSVYLSRIYAAAQGVAGVSWVDVPLFRRQDDPTSDGIPTGEIPVRRLEVARLDDDPSHPDRGALRLRLKGGR